MTLFSFNLFILDKFILFCLLVLHLHVCAPHAGPKRLLYPVIYETGLVGHHVGIEPESYTKAVLSFNC